MDEAIVVVRIGKNGRIVRTGNGTARFFTSRSPISISIGASGQVANIPAGDTMGCC